MLPYGTHCCNEPAPTTTCELNIQLSAHGWREIGSLPMFPAIDASLFLPPMFVPSSLSPAHPRPCAAVGPCDAIDRLRETVRVLRTTVVCFTYFNPLSVVLQSCPRPLSFSRNLAVKPSVCRHCWSFFPLPSPPLVWHYCVALASNRQGNALLGWLREFVKYRRYPLSEWLLPDQISATLRMSS